MARRIPVKPLNGDGIVFAWVDDEDYEWISGWKWRLDHLGYALRRYYAGKVNGVRKQKVVKMHRQILGVSDAERVDHRDMCKLNNTRANLRIATQAENVRNTDARKTMRGKPCSSAYKGVAWDKKRNNWLASIAVNQQTTVLGAFTDEEGAAHAYDEAARRLHGEFGRLNFPHLDATANLQRSAQSKVFPRKQSTNIRNVSVDRRTGHYRVFVSVKNKTVYVGTFERIEDAEAAAVEARRTYRGEDA